MVLGIRYWVLGTGLEVQGSGLVKVNKRKSTLNLSYMTPQDRVIFVIKLAAIGVAEP